MNAIKIDAMIDEEVVKAIPGLSPLLGRRVELIARETTRPAAPAGKLTVDQLLASRVQVPHGSGPITQEGLDRAVAEGALGR